MNKYRFAHLPLCLPHRSPDMKREYEFVTAQIQAEELRAVRKNNFLFLTNTLPD